MRMENIDRTNTWAMLCHLSSLAMFVAPFGNLLGPLVIWLIKKDESGFIDRHGKESLNFQGSVTLYYIILCVTIIGIPLTAVLLILQVVFVIIASIEANKGNSYTYPLTIRFIK